MEDIVQQIPTEIVPTENVYIKALINGLGATIILWTFWTPFIIGFARPLVNAQIKGYTCDYLSYLGAGQAITFNNSLQLYLMTLLDSGVISQSQRDYIANIFFVNQGNDTVAANIINQDPQKNLDDNFLIIVLFAVTYFLVILSCCLGIYALSSWFSIDLGPLYKFNAVMALIIIAIEATFFGSVAMSYIPFDINLIIEQLKFKLDSYLSDIGSQQLVDPGPPPISPVPPVPPVPKPACQFQAAPLQDYFIGDWVQPTTNFGTLDEAQQRCILTSQCVGVTTTGDGNYILTSTRNKYVEYPGTTYQNKGSTSWLLNECR
uniref:Uncharacterized protein n=1 Tax=viral metagenome TaxID=1070528 RepID=A0A6C0HFT0_9ZZZZ